MANPLEQRQRIIEASVGQPFRFAQCSVPEIRILGLTDRRASESDTSTYFSGKCDGSASHGTLDLSDPHGPTVQRTEAVPNVHLWFGDHQVALDLAEKFAGDTSDDLGPLQLPEAITTGPIAADNGSDASIGACSLVTKMSVGKIPIDPSALCRLIASQHVAGFAEREAVDGPHRAFAATIPLHHLLEAVGQSSAKH